MLIKERAMVHFFDRFSDHPFVIRMDGHEDKIGEGTPAFVVNLKRQIPVKELASSTSLALGEAYMRGSGDRGGFIPGSGPFPWADEPV